ncbi:MULTISPECIES: phosphatidate cytidylyltransferase [Corynebacterium]|uniref:Phosphatidate cytidylyltransferase n=2 Tax=Corynebacterium glucuronolyticum TaxID=39791 RepID=A0A7T4JU64_9CORY|nr:MULTISPECIES: phosphatidate cytidylyltransferase [Corynebacterium]MCT1441140.1 phosphatidate cytidylyltransferase [Corynebacterium glucuronolyticum]MCT1562186.1 phosphatidate cytidylyltransferase [Corynebacterium glucuronolyticum]QQB45497.1 phosphatidate cytidylyltransferase [Corynebacterium glucuronolyticum]QRO83001.1 phosphatidate cytidylyltransferase [Corynebacterium glucuronolyticum]QRP69752.1 phosphatidate cytidylyltransferase [Corynebacterium glucuronolyticum]
MSRPDFSRFSWEQLSEVRIPRPKNDSGRNMPAAITTSVILIAIVLVGILVGPVAWYPIVATAVALATWEVHRRLTEGGYAMSLSILLFGGQIMVWSSWPWGLWGLMAGYVSSILLVMFSRLFRNGRHTPPRNYWRDMSMSVFVLTWIALFGSFIAMLSNITRHDIPGPMFILTFMLCVIASDTGGFLAGVGFGSHSMAPAVSPNKSWEGFAGSLALGMVVGALTVRFLLHANPLLGVVLGALLVIAATLGDLVESQFKRELGIKDMSRMLPGHGGLMDRLDGMLPAGVVTWLILSILQT